MALTGLQTQFLNASISGDKELLNYIVKLITSNEKRKEISSDEDDSANEDDESKSYALYAYINDALDTYSMNKIGDDLYMLEDDDLDILKTSLTVSVKSDKNNIVRSLRNIDKLTVMYISNGTFDIKSIDPEKQFPVTFRFNNISYLFFYTDDDITHDYTLGEEYGVNSRIVIFIKESARKKLNLADDDVAIALISEDLKEGEFIKGDLSTVYEIDDSDDSFPPEVPIILLHKGNQEEEEEEVDDDLLIRMSSDDVKRQNPVIKNLATDQLLSSVVDVAYTKFGLGIIALRDIPASKPLDFYTGAIHDDYPMHGAYIIKNSHTNQYIDAGPLKTSNWTRYINSVTPGTQETPNVLYYELAVSKGSLHQILVTTIRDIKAGEELLVYYGDSYFVFPSIEILDNSDLTKIEYLTLGSVEEQNVARNYITEIVPLDNVNSVLDKNSSITDMFVLLRSSSVDKSIPGVIITIRREEKSIVIEDLIILEIIPVKEQAVDLLIVAIQAWILAEEITDVIINTDGDDDDSDDDDDDQKPWLRILKLRVSRQLEGVVSDFKVKQLDKSNLENLETLLNENIDLRFSCANLKQQIYEINNIYYIMHPWFQNEVLGIILVGISGQYTNVVVNLCVTNKFNRFPSLIEIKILDELVDSINPKVTFKTSIEKEFTWSNDAKKYAKIRKNRRVIIDLT